jgi:hypothetical protein
MAKRTARLFLLVAIIDASRLTKYVTWLMIVETYLTKKTAQTTLNVHSRGSIYLSLASVMESLIVLIIQMSATISAIIKLRCLITLQLK